MGKQTKKRTKGSSEYRDVQNQKNKHKGQKRPIVRTRHWIEVIALLLVIGCLIGNSLYGEGYDATKLPANGGALVDYYGYTMSEDGHFQYNGDKGSYVSVSKQDGVCNQLTLTFLECPDQDIDATLRYVDKDGNLLDQGTGAVWEKGSYFVCFRGLNKKKFEKYIVTIPCDFTVDNVYYATHNGRSGNRLIAYYFAMCILAIFVASVLLFNKNTAKFCLEAEQRIISLWKYILSNKGFLAKKAAFLIGIVIIGDALVYFIGVRNGYLAWHNKMVIAASLFSLIVGICIVFYRFLASRIEIIGFFVILISGTIFAFTEPANVGVSWDDESHFLQSVELSHTLDQRLSIADTEIIDVYQQVALNKLNYTRPEQIRTYQILDGLDRMNYQSGFRGQVPWNVRCSYFPSAIGLCLARGIGLPWHMTVYLGRWMNTLFLAIIALLSMRKLQSGKIVPLLILLMPTTLFLSGNYSYDTWLTGWTIYGLSQFFGEWQQPEKKITWKTGIGIGAALFLGFLPKLVYFPLGIIPIFMSPKKFQTKRDLLLYRIVILVFLFLPFAVLFIQSFMTPTGIGNGDTRGGSDVDAAGQTEFIKKSPKKFAQMMVTFLRQYLNPLATGRDYIQNMAYIGYAPFDTKAYLCMIIGGALISREEKEAKFPWWTKLGLLVEYIGIGFIAALSMYVMFTPVGEATVLGCQGRYLTPVLFPLLYVLTRFSTKTRVKNLIREENLNIILICYLVAACIWGLTMGCLKLYS